MSSAHSLPRALICTTPDYYRLVYTRPVLEKLTKRVAIEPRSYSPAELIANPEPLRDVEYLFTTWKGPRLDAALLASAPRLRAVFHAAGTVKSLVTPEFWASGIAIHNAQVANGLPVADFAYAQILLALKSYWRLCREARANHAMPADRQRGPGIKRATIGLISLGGIARALIEKLAPHQPALLAYDPYADPITAALLGVRLVGLEELFSESEVVSCHAPLNDETTGLVTESLLGSMRPQATFLNTARGRVIAPGAIETVFARRPDLTALLDVTDPEPLPANSKLWEMPNVILSPHIAGSTGRDCENMVEAMIGELDRFMAGEPTRFSVTAEAVAMAT